MKALVVGASGATGKLVVAQFIKRNIPTRILVRERTVLPEELVENPLVETVKGNINELVPSEMETLVQNCTVVISCLGHNISFRGLFGHPWYLVRDAIKNLSEAIRKNSANNVKLILMSTTAYTNTVSGEKNSIGERIIFSLLTFLLPPHRDNVKAAKYLINDIGKQNEKIEWVAVRPDTLTNEDAESEYNICESPVRSPVFNAGTTSRINVSNFMGELVMNDILWKKWLYKTPVIYNNEKNEQG